jgi:hypothetical protein
MKTIRLTRLQVFNGVAYHKNEDHNVSDSIAELAAKRGVLNGEPREYVPPVAEVVAPEAAVEVKEATLEAKPGATPKPRK